MGNTSINLADHIADLEARLLEMNVWTLLGLWLQSFVVGFTMWALTICIFIIIYGRMIEIYLVTSIAPIPMATMMGKEWGGMGQNYLRSLQAYELPFCQVQQHLGLDRVQVFGYGNVCHNDVPPSMTVEN